MAKRKRGVVDTVNRRETRSMAKRKRGVVDTVNRRETRSMAKMRISQLEIKDTKPLPFDIIHDILVRLPVKILTNFRLVCKQWDSLISLPVFQHDHYRRCQQNPLYLSVLAMNGFHRVSTYCNGKGGLSFVNKFSVSNKRHPGTRTYRIQSCLGLVCVTSMYGNIAFVCNPSTKERLVLPSTQGPNTCFGFGYAPSSKEFRVFMFYYRRKTICCKAIALGAHEWREVNSPPFQTPMVCLGAAPFLHGDLHLLHCGDNEYSITAFDIETEEYRQVRVPADYHDVDPFGELLDIGGSLSLIGRRDKLLEIWLLKDYKSAKWVKEYTIDSSLVARQGCFKATVLEISVDGSLKLALDGGWLKEFLWYNPHYKTATHKIRYDNCSWGLFVESFRSLGSGYLSESHEHHNI